ncbi:MAG: sodium:calcium antiporter [Candidatus Paceibacterota bacterium]
MTFYILLFLFSCLLLIYSGSWLVKSLSRISEFLGLKRFTVAFLLMSLATAAPELFIGISSALRGIPELSLGNIIGQNIVHFTAAIFICVLVSGGFWVRSKTVKTTALFSAFIALFPLLLILDGDLSRIDGLILIGLFVVYVLRMLKNGKRHDIPFDDLRTKNNLSILKKIILFFRDFGGFIFGAVLLMTASQGIVKSSIFFAEKLNMPLVMIGVLIVGLGTALPEVYFSAFSANKKEGELMAGNLFGSTVVSTCLVLGLVSLISPISNIDFFSYFWSRLALFVSVIFFIYFMLTGRKVSTKESWILLLIYLLFISLEIFIK